MTTDSTQQEPSGSNSEGATSRSHPSAGSERRRCATLAIVFIAAFAISGATAGFLISPVAGCSVMAILSWWIARTCGSVLKDLHAKEQDEITKRAIISQNAQEEARDE